MVRWWERLEVGVYGRVFGCNPNMASAEILSSRLATPHVFLGNCPRCSTPLEYLPPAGSSSSPQGYRIRCFSCGSVISHAPTSEQTRPNDSAKPDAGPQPSTNAKRNGRKIGSDDRPLVRLGTDQNIAWPLTSVGGMTGNWILRPFGGACQCHN